MTCDKKSFIKYVMILFLFGTMYLVLLVKYPVHIEAFHTHTKTFVWKAANFTRNITRTIGKSQQHYKSVTLKPTTNYKEIWETHIHLSQNYTSVKVQFSTTTTTTTTSTTTTSSTSTSTTTKRVKVQFSTTTQPSSTQLKLTSKKSSPIRSGRRITTKPPTQQKQSTDKVEDSWMEEQTRRNERIREVCKANPHLFDYRVSRNWLLYDSKHKLLFCGNAKVYTSTWMSHFHQLEARRDGKKWTQGELQNLIPERFRLPHNIVDVRSLAERSISFSMVRHPFERLVSAYEDKVNYKSDMKDYAKNSYVANIKDSIIREFGSVSFTNFVRHVIREVSSSPNRGNVHWRPYYGKCDYCNVLYKVILKSESYPSDLEQLGRMANVTFSTSERIHSTNTTRDLTKKYMKELPRDVLLQLYHVFKIDFDMFEYDEKQYFDS